MCNVFYFVTNYHTLAGADRHVKIMFESSSGNNLLPKASTCRFGIESTRTSMMFVVRREIAVPFKPCSQLDAQATRLHRTQ